MAQLKSGSTMDGKLLVDTSDPRLSDARVPTTHESVHITGGADEIPSFTPTASGLVPLSGGGTEKYLRADGTWAVPPDTPTITYSTTDLTAGVSALPTGNLYFVYEA